MKTPILFALFASLIAVSPLVAANAAPAGGKAPTAPAPRPDDGAPPDALTMRDGRKVTSAEMWRQERRPEIIELFRQHVYGRAPVDRPADLKFEVTATDPNALDGAAIRQDVTLTFSGPGGKGELHVLLFVPKPALGPAPCFLLTSHRARPPISAANLNSPYWPVARIIARGYATAAFATNELAPDRKDNASAREGVFPLFDPATGRTPDAWATIGAWAWGASRVMDYLVTNPAIDAQRVAVIGHSRGGKTALWAGAQDERFALVVSNDSGCTGAALARGKTGERIANINLMFPHWFSGNYHRYGQRERELPVDQHLLLAAVAPRPLSVASATDDRTADPQAEFQSCVLASPVYELLGQKGVGATAFPAPGTTLHTGRIGYHLRPGGHGLAEYDWDRHLDFADQHLGRPAAGR